MVFYTSTLAVERHFAIACFFTSITIHLDAIFAVYHATKILSADPTACEPRLSDVLLRGGQSYETEWPKFESLVKEFGATPNNSDIWPEIATVWTLREILEISLNMFRDIPGPSGPLNPILHEIWNEILEPSITEGRYIMALCGGTLVSLATLNVIQSWPRDKFVWGSILSRYTLGILMILLLLLNIGHGQTIYIPQGRRAAVLDWIEHAWAIPTLALAYVAQFWVDTILLIFSLRYSKKELARGEQGSAVVASHPVILCRYEARAGPSSSSRPPSDDNDNKYDGADCIDMGEILNSDLSPGQKIRILKRIYDMTTANPPSQAHSSLLRVSHQYADLLTEVNGNNDDSEVQAQRAIASPAAHGQARSISDVRAEESDVEMQRGGDGVIGDDAEGDGRNGASEPESDVEASLASEVGAQVQGSSMAVLEDEGEGTDHRASPRFCREPDEEVSEKLGQKQ
ncbi:hypothetical protein FRC09_000194 [Ceratobasidium sp. 395]|nr:hypothetical protein FRC09_000194 [Ceratobasidium sp. 395]